MKPLSGDQIKAALRKRARVAFGVYLLSLILPLPMPGAYAFFLGFSCVISPIAGVPATASEGDRAAFTLVGLAWLANPLILAGTIALHRGATLAALILASAAIGFALIASPLVLMTMVLLLAYLIWLCSMGLVLYGALRPVRPPQAQPVSPERMPTSSPRETRPLRTSDGKPLSEREVDKMMEHYDELP
jgi:hypothetical protein